MIGAAEPDGAGRSDAGADAGVDIGGGTIAALAAALGQAPALLVSVVRTEGSAPREVGAWLAVTAGAQFGSVGGGRLEFEAVAAARAELAAGRCDAAPRRHALGPSLGQCCGGVVYLRHEMLTAADAPGLAARLAAPPLIELALFGGGHVGRAIAKLVADLPARLHWIDSREQIFPPGLPATIRTEHSEPVQAAVAQLAAGACVLVMSFSHAEDLDIVAACLERRRRAADLRFIGLIGSATKWARFAHRLEARGFTSAEIAGVTCPIGLPGIRGKQPEVIALSAVAQLLTVCDG
ncbi:MAG: xanthine dehydrogenase accessory protein XdhC [Pelomonas sp.]|nr:xanthine dehydrogenase accessory protein XdhC [Roseateles sp.]